MKNIKLQIALLIGGILLFSGCQRDDICPEATQTTPMLIIRFYDFEDQDEERAPNNLTIIDTERDSIYAYRVNLDSIAIPLKTFENQTEFAFIRNAPELNQDGEELDPDEGEDEDETPGEEDPDEDDGGSPLTPQTDIINFSYVPDEVYVNRACAFRVEFLDLKYAYNEGENGGWMQNIVIEQLDVTDENEKHISIYY